MANPCETFTSRIVVLAVAYCSSCPTAGWTAILDISGYSGELLFARILTSSGEQRASVEEVSTLKSRLVLERSDDGAQVW